jgi:P-type Mg2+ transporter
VRVVPSVSGEGAGRAVNVPGVPVGLTGEDAARRLAADGPNEPVPVTRFSALTQLLRLFANPLVVILLVASVISASLGQRVDASIIVTMVLLGVAIDFWQSYRSQEAADRLRSSVTPTATVMRDGAWKEIPLRDVVAGDVIRLSAGDLVPADSCLLESRDLSVQQSMLGFSVPPLSYLLFVVLATLAYLGAAELAKRPLVRRLGLQGRGDGD